MATTKPDVVRRRGGKMAAYLGTLLESEPAVRQPFELGFAAMNACNWDEAVGHFRNAVMETKGAGVVALLNLIGVCHYTEGRPGEALKDFLQSARLAEEFNDEQGKSRALGNIGLIYHDNGELDLALKHQEEALATARELGDEWAVAIHLGHTGNVLHDKGEFDKALEYYREALASSREIGDQWGVATQLGNMGSVYLDKGDFDTALEHYKEALAISRQTGDRWGVASNLGNMGSVYRAKGNLDEALRYENEALTMAWEIGHQLGVATDLGNIGLILTAQKQDEQAVPKLAEALTILLAIGAADGPRQTLTGLAGCEDRLGRKRLMELLKQAGRDEGVITDLLERIDMMRMKRPESNGKPPAPVPQVYEGPPSPPGDESDTSGVSDPIVGSPDCA
jgi:tetratricopeptide (TPR) repeat protein